MPAELMRTHVRESDYARFLCAQFAPPGLRTGLYSVAAFSAEAERIPARVNEPAMGQLRVAWWREALEHIEAGSPPDHPLALALAATVPALAGGRTHFETILDTLDASFASGEASGTQGALGVAVQRAWMELLGVRDAPAADAAAHAAQAWALATTDPEGAVTHIASARELRRRVPAAGLPAMLLAALAEQAVRRTQRNVPAAGPLAMQAVLVRSALFGRY
jgi:phytoene/squalene synthetase